MNPVRDFLLQKLFPLWHKPVVGVAFALLIGASSFLSLGAVTNDYLRIALAVIAMLSMFIVWWYLNKLPVNDKNHIGIAVAIHCDDERETRQIDFDFIRSLRQLLHRDPEAARFKLIKLPTRIAEQIVSADEALVYLRRTKCHLMLYGSSKLRKLQGKEVHVLKLQFIITHAPLPPQTRQRLAIDISEALPKEFVLPSENDAYAFDMTSSWVDVCARFSIGMAALLSRDFPYAEKLLLEVERLIRDTRNMPPMAETVAQQLPERLKMLYRMWCQTIGARYSIGRERRILEVSDAVSSKLLHRDPDNYNGLLVKAICEFTLRRNLPEAKRLISKCRRIKDATWRYSLAFMHAYEGELEKAHDEYRQANRRDLATASVPLQTEEFIYEVLQEEPNMEQLYFCLALINFNMKRDMEAAARDFDRFLSSSCIGQYPWAKAKAIELQALCNVA